MTGSMLINIMKNIVTVQYTIQFLLFLLFFYFYIFNVDIDGIIGVYGIETSSCLHPVINPIGGVSVHRTTTGTVDSISRSVWNNLMVSG